MADDTKKVSFAQSIVWLLKQYQNIKQTNASENKYRIVNIEKCSRHGYKLTIQIVGKNNTFVASPLQIARDDELISNFSKADVRTVTYLACEQQRLPKAKINFKKFCIKLQKLVFGIQKTDSDETLEKTAAEISMDKKLINSLNQEDAHMVGYTTATEMIAEEQRQKEMLAKQNKDS